jgi:hypothetical protein
MNRTTHHYISSSFSWLLLFASLLLAGCSSADVLPDDPFMGKARALNMVLVNHTDRYISTAWVDKYWAANINARYEDGSPRGGNKSVCCYSGVTDWKKPVKVTWQWGREEEPPIIGPKGRHINGKVTKPDEDHEAMVAFPPRFPLDSKDMFKKETALCVIFRDLNTVELQYSVGGFDCDKR